MHLFQKTVHVLELLTIVLQGNTIEDDEFNMFLFSMLLLGLAFICISLALAIFAVIISLLVIFGLITIGALSVSVLVGLNKKSITTGFRTFVVFFSTFAMTVLGAISFWILNRIIHWWSQIKSIVLGSGIGLVSGLIIGIVIAFIIKKLSAFLKHKLDSRKMSIS